MFKCSRYIYFKQLLIIALQTFMQVIIKVASKNVYDCKTQNEVCGTSLLKTTLQKFLILVVSLL